jgi:hypothetical protein
MTCGGEVAAEMYRVHAHVEWLRDVVTWLGWFGCHDDSRHGFSQLRLGEYRADAPARERRSIRKDSV